MSCNIHETAIVDPAAELGKNVEVGPYSIIGPHVQLGDGCWVGPHAVIEGRTTLGENCEVFQFASVGAKPQDLKFNNEPSTLVLGSGNKIREFVTLQPGTEHGHMTTVIGDNNLFMANSHVGHDCKVGSNNVFANSAALAGHVTIDNNVILGGIVGIHQFVRIGSFVMLSGGSMVGHDIPPYCIGQGDRCFLRGVNTIGLQRAGFTDEEVSAVKKTYRLLFSSVGGLAEKVKGLPQELRAMEKISHMIDFIESSERGVCSPARNKG